MESMVFWVACWFAEMLGGMEVSIVRARLNAAITSRALVFFLVMFLVALVSVPIFWSPIFCLLLRMVGIYKTYHG